MSMPIIVSSTTTREQAITDLIQSIALEETGLSHIINAEGEKIQAVVAMTNVTSQQLLDVNTSVQKLLQTVTNLEIVLESKLNLFGASLQA